METRARWVASLVTLSLVVAAFAWIEWRTPYAFCQDDNRDNFLPLYVHTLRGLSEGDLAEWNRHQSLGLPHLANGQSAVFHPLPSLALLASRGIAGHDFLTIEIMVLFGMLLGGIGMVWLLDELDGALPALLLGGVSWGLCPFLLYAARSWQNYAALCAALPWCLWALFRVLRGRLTYAEVFVGVGAHLWVFYLGTVQWVANMLFFEGLLLASLLSFGQGWRACRRGLLGWMLVLTTTAASSLPLLLPMWRTVSNSSERAAALAYETFASEPLGIRAVLNGLFFPWVRLFEPSADRAFTELASPPSLTHLGLGALFLLIAAPFVWRRSGGLRKLDVVCLVLAGVAVLWAVGVLSPLLYRLPIYNRFRWQFKLYPFAFFFLTIVASRLLNGISAWRGRLAITIVLLQVASLLSVAGGNDFLGFFSHADRLPLREPLKESLRDGRIFTVGQVAGVGEHAVTAPLLGFDYATLFGLQHFGGYDPLMPSRNYEATLRLNYSASYNLPPRTIPMDYLRFWGVRWYVVRTDLARVFQERVGVSSLRVAARDEQRTVFLDGQALPMHRSLRGRCRFETVGHGVDRLELEAECAEDDLAVLAYLDDPMVSIRVDGVETPTAGGRFGEIVFPLSTGSSRVVLEYSDPLVRVGGSLTALWWIGLATWAQLGKRRALEPPRDATSP